MKTAFILLVFTQLFTSFLFSLLPFRKHGHSVTQSNNFAHSSDEFQKTSLDQAECMESCTCNLTLPKPKKVINPYRELLNNRVAQKPFGSFCLKCAACLAVANEIQTVIEDVSQECETDLEKKKILLEETQEKIENLCETGFRNFNLRAYEHHGILTNNFECTHHLASVIEENWTKRLREICNVYISRVDLRAITSNVLDSSGSLSDMFCRGSGVFRDCSNIKNHKNISLPQCKNCGH